MQDLSFNPADPVAIDATVYVQVVRFLRGLSFRATPSLSTLPAPGPICQRADELHDALLASGRAAS